MLKGAPLTCVSQMLEFWVSPCPPRVLMPPLFRVVQPLKFITGRTPAEATSMLPILMRLVAPMLM